jgi:hypothetical protein
MHSASPSRPVADVILAGEEHVARVRVHNFTISIDAYGAGPRQTREEPLGVGGEALLCAPRQMRERAEGHG